MDEEFILEAIKQTSTLNPETIQLYIEKHFERTVDLHTINNFLAINV